MTRRKWLVLALALAGCGKVAELPPDVFPAQMAGGWRRTQVRDLAASDAPDPVPRNEIERLREAVYEGPGMVSSAGPSRELEARVYQLDAPAMGVDLSQRWRPSADTVFFASGRYFVVVKWHGADRAALQEFIHGLETRLSKSAK